MITVRDKVSGTASLDVLVDWNNGDKPSQSGWAGHTVVRMEGDNEHRLPAWFQFLNDGWGPENVQIPSMVYMPEKQRLFVVVERYWSEHEFPRGKTFSSYSDDFGATWSEPKAVCDSHGRNLHNAVGLTYLGQGCLTFGIEFVTEGGPMRWFSDDYGQTWSRSIPISPSVTGKPMYYWDPMLIDRDEHGEIIRLLEGRYWETGERPFESGEGAYSQAGLWHSEDGALTWSPEIGVPQWRGVNEVALIRAANGNIVAACRTDNPERFIGQYDLYSGLGVSISRDNGTVWSELGMLYEFGRHHPSLVLMPNGDIVMAYAVRQGYEDTADGRCRYGIEALLSTDNGESWDLDRRFVLATWESKFGGEFSWLTFAQSTTTALLPDGHLLTVFGTGMRYRGPHYCCDKDTAMVKWSPYQS